jgi:hypothetical protein
VSSKVALLLVVAAAGQLGAQGIVRGAVTTEQGQRIAGVELRVAVLNKSVRTDSLGEYKMVLPAGSYWLTTRALGFFSLGDSIAPEKDVELIHDFTLTSLAQVLGPVTTTAPSKYRGSGLQGFEQRMKTGQGKYVTEEDFARYTNRLLADVLRRMPGLLVKQVGGSANYATSQRNGVATKGGCYVAVFLDGMALYNGPRQGAPPDLNLFPNSTLAGAEFYASTATSPVQYKDKTGCGMLLLWTRER